MKRWIWVWAVSLGLTACQNGRVAPAETTAEATVGIPAETTAETAPCVQLPENGVELLYFHGKKRCATCLAIERHAREVVETQFAEALAAGQLVFRSIDLSDKASGELAEKYEVTWSSLFLNQWKEGREISENLTDFAFGNARTAPEAFKSGLVEKINALLP